MNNIRNILAAALLATTGHAVAASSTDLSVKGTITPSACTPSFSNGGVIDFGKFSAKELNVERPTRLEKQYLQLGVTCDAATLFALKGDDNRTGSVPETYEGNYGLGIINGNEKLGSFYIVLSSAVADGAPARFIGSDDGGASWWVGSGMSVDYLTAVADNSSVTPMPVKVMSGEMMVQTIIVPAQDLTLTSEVPLDGSVTVTVMYL